MLQVVASLWDFLSKFIAFVFGSTLGYLFRFSANECFSDSCFDELKDRQSSDDVDQGNREAENYSSMVASSSKYEFLYGNRFSGFIEEPKAERFTVHEFYTDPGESFSAGKEKENSLEANGIDESEAEELVEEKSNESFNLENVLEKEPELDETEESALRFSFDWGFLKHIQQQQSIDAKVRVEEETVHDVVKTEDVKETAKDYVVEKRVKVEKEDIFEDKAEESVGNYIIEESLGKHLSDVEEKFDNFFESPVIDMYIQQWRHERGEPNKEWEMFSPTNTVDAESITYEISSNRVDLRPHSHGRNVESTSDATAAADISGPINDSDDKFIELCVMGGAQPGEDLSVEEEGDSEFESDDDDDEEDELMERLRMEMKMARTGGLPTILEESESPKIEEQLRPLKINEKYDHKDHIAEIQKVCKNYCDKMKKLDILNSQTMHAISLLQLKDPGIKSLLSHNAWLFKQRKVGGDPAMKFIRDLYIDFETVYVGQVCLSWEILHWQYGKLKMLSESDSLGIHQYNQVAGEFQRFQVLVQRFLEDEPFQNRPRIENYTKNRCALRYLLHVPVIKDDCSRNKLDDAVSDEMLSDIIEESMHVLWEFIRADKDNSSVIPKTPQQAQVAPHDPIDLELLMDVRADLHKKEKRFKEIQRTKNCIVKKLKKQQGGNLLDQALFIAQVELKLVSRVLNMVKISTDQLVWCHEKLRRINFRSRKIEIEPSFTLFPC
ncbi:Ribosomal protein L34e superfamily protein [Hibiscus syriacus]|uniref:Ribosomal protein L34e superfamily protein n=1 Tax=Hibiscus syriacus TaxID=106335 RepID=A0A6A3CR19_HIBSY|nr:uncharacterized protein LOC120169274 [Hibiscus syriacus]KAE8729992.1 Ribosomal protein L34e superfamily protein [Hibiscus syriacus]